MADPDPSLDAMLHSLGESALGEPAEHPSRDQLVAYCRSELTPEQSEAVAAHLAWCRDDADFVLAFREIAGLDPPEEEPAEELDAAWSDFQRRRGPALAGPPAPAALPSRPARSGWRRWRTPVALAASLLGAVVVISLVLPGRPTAPLANGQIVDLGATDEERAAGVEAKEIVLQPDDGLLTVILHPTRELSAERFSVALLDGNGEEIWQSDVRPKELETFRVTFPREFLSAAEYVLELRARDDGRFEVLDRFPVRVVLEEP